MFRRKEESLFDTTTDANYAQPAPAESGTNSSTANNSGSNATSGTSGTSGSATSGTTGSGASSTGGISRPLPDSRPVSSAPQSTSNFRPNASPIGSEITRNRLPETKPVQTSLPPGVVLDKSTKPGRRVLTVGNDILLKGEIATCDRLVIEGKVDATLNDVHTVEISENGSFKGSAQIEDAEISGLFEGDLIVRNRLVIYATGKVRGKITYGEIEIERGGELTGEIKTVSASGIQPNTRPATTRPAVTKEAVAA